MLRLPRFRYYAPQTLAEAVRMLADHGSQALLVAGGTDVFPKMKRRQFRPQALIGLRGLRELVGIRGDTRSGLVIGAGTTLSQLAAHPEVRAGWPGLATAAGVVSTPVLRNMGTVGGNLCLDTRCNYYDQSYEWRKAIRWCKKAPGEGLTPEQVPCRVAPGSPRCWAVSSTDTAPMFIALEAELVLVGPRGERTIPARALYRDDGMNYLTKARDEILTEIRLPPSQGIKSAYQKLRRRGAFDFPALGVAVAVRLDEGGNIQRARIVLGGIASHPVEMTSAEHELIGQPPTDPALEAAAQAAFGPARPMDNTDFHLFYRKKMVPVFLKRALRQALQA